MEQSQLEKLREWFDSYVAGAYNEDDYINANLKLKEDHSRRVGEEMLFLADELELGENQRRIAEAIGLLHDVGRFKQFIEYQTYNDPRSVNHCLLGLEILAEENALDEIESEERQWIEWAIEYHGLKVLPCDLDGEALLYSQMIRDADKLDIFEVVIEGYRRYMDDPEVFNLEVELPEEPAYSAEVVDALMRGERIDYADLRTMADMRLLQLCWVYDVNFTATLRRIKQRKSLETLFEYLPADETIAEVRKKILGYVDAKIAEAG